ncbi:potassium-transporting ATPase subunit KdpC [Pseudomonas sp. CNPSo 3701]|uniref:potassium-transporting ATPase subunit KdpC n=1 Tax=Pseudomonas sp. CNPSo 3701 TaxID=3027943 RepID=UPI0023641EBE|nr:potassium-transporting ATPase subunit KdpC [Pseudomonas sp. CNPSo 3701]MDD1509816.1 potassium-transporting ATPase subunit KdpC [Pseudomonas sp. CNPSo 3701]
MTNQTTMPQGNLLRPACVLALISLLGFGLSYSLVATGIGNGLFPEQANGNLIERDGTVIGSQWVAQPFTSPGYFQARPSAASYDPMAVSGSNQARTNPALRQRIDEQRPAIAAREGVEPGAVPGDLLTQSGGGLDPHISPEAAQIQVVRVARERGMSPGEVQTLVSAYTEGRQWGLFGEPRVNVLLLNLALDEAHSR